MRIGLLQLPYPLVQPDLSVFSLIVAFERGELPLLQPTEGEDDVRAQIREDVLGGELADLDSVLGPVGVVADHLVSILLLLRAGGAHGVVVRFPVPRPGPPQLAYAGGYRLVFGC